MLKYSIVIEYDANDDTDFPSWLAQALPCGSSDRIEKVGNP